MKITIPRLTSRPGKGGKRRYFWQPSSSLRTHGWRLQRLSDDFAQACREAEQWNAKVDAWRVSGDTATPDRDVTTLGGVIRAYQRHRYFLDKRESTRRGYIWLCKQIEDWAGDRPIAAITAVDIDTLFCVIRQTAPTLANGLLVMLRTIYKFAAMQGYCTDNPALKVRQSKVDVENRTWSTAAVEACVAAADAGGRHSVGTAVALNAWLGQRQGDVLALARPQIVEGVIHIRQGKTGARVELPVGIVPHLVQRIEDELARQIERRQRRAAAAGVTLSPHATIPAHLIVSEETDQPYKPDNFRHVFARVRSAAAAAAAAAGNTELATELAALDFLHLRHTAVTALAQAGCEIPQIAAVTGHSLAAVEQILDRYLVRTAALARSAFERRLAAEKGKTR